MMVEQLAHELGMDPLELRRKNFIPKEDFLAEVAIGIVYDSGDYHGSLDKLLTHRDLAAFRREQEELRAKGIYRGIGFSTWMEICGLAALARRRTDRGRPAGGFLYESSTVRVHATARRPSTAAPPRTARASTPAFAQIVVDRLGITPDMVDVVHGDTGTGPFGLGTYGSRSLAGRRVDRPLDRQLVDKAKQIAAHNLEAAPRTSSSSTVSSPSRARPTRAS